VSGVIVIGAGPGIGLSVARRFAREGLPVGLIARSPATVDAALAALEGTGVETRGATADAADEGALRSALDGLAGRLGVPDALVYNAALIQWDSIGELSAAWHLDAWAVNVVGAITAAAHLLPRMAERGGGTYVITGGMPEPVPEVTSLSLGKAGVRALAELLDKRFGPSGVHVSTVTVGRAVAPGTAFDSDDIAEHYWRLHMQRPDAWEREVLLDGELRACDTGPGRIRSKQRKERRWWVHSPSFRKSSSGTWATSCTPR
jgi:NAD(P)-dependent dehydrogenase (short-subunit alcohol dehydrogenase family)